MPKIVDYNLQTSAAGPSREASANVEDTGNVGNAMRVAGDQVEAAGVLLDRRMGQADVADQYAATANAREKIGNELTQRVTSAGEADIAGKNPDGSLGQSMRDKFADYVDREMQNLPEPTTRAGREFAERQRAAMRGHFLESMGRAQVSLQGAQAVQVVRNAVNTQANALEADPSQFKSIVNGHAAYVEGQVATDGLPANKAAELKQYGNQQFAEGAAKGYIKADPETGQKLLDSGMFDSYLTRAQKDSLSQYADQHIRAQQSQTEHDEKQAKKAADDVISTSQISMLHKMGAGKLSPNDVLNDPAIASVAKVNPEKAYAATETMLQVLRRTQTEQAEGNPVLANQLAARVFMPDDPKRPGQKIIDMAQVYPHIGPGGISVAQAQHIQSYIDKTPEGKFRAAQLNTVMTGAKKAIMGDPLSNMMNPHAEQDLENFRVSYMDAYNKQVKAGLNPSQHAWNSKSPDYLGNMINQFHQSPEDAIAGLAQHLDTKAMPSIAPVAPPVGKTAVFDRNGNPGFTTWGPDSAAKGYRKR